MYMHRVYTCTLRDRTLPNTWFWTWSQRRTSMRPRWTICTRQPRNHLPHHRSRHRGRGRRKAASQKRQRKRRTARWGRVFCNCCLCILDIYKFIYIHTCHICNYFFNMHIYIKSLYIDALLFDLQGKKGKNTTEKKKHESGKKKKKSKKSKRAPRKKDKKAKEETPEDKALKEAKEQSKKEANEAKKAGKSLWSTPTTCQVPSCKTTWVTTCKSKLHDSPCANQYYMIHHVQINTTWFTMCKSTTWFTMCKSILHDSPCANQN